MQIHNMGLEGFLNDSLKPTYLKIPFIRDGFLMYIYGLNGWFDEPRDIVAAFQWIIYVSVESRRIIDRLPDEITGV